jgi:membrane protease YdiL (CAAX protease family)
MTAAAAETATIAFRTPAAAPRWQRWLWYSPLARIVIFAATTAALVFVLRLLAASLGWTARSAPAAAHVAALLLVGVLPAVATYLFLCRAIERRWPAELAWRRIVPDGVVGTLAGVALISAVVAVLWLAGSYRVTGTNGEARWWMWLLAGGLVTGVVEEIAMRGVLFHISEEGLGTWSALALSSLVFGIVHLGNPNATAWSAIAIAIEAGLLLGLVYHVWRSLPLCIGVHMGWNMAQGPLYGVPVSGSATPSWLIATREGPAWLTGGEFGAEASVVAVAISLGCSLVLVALALRRHSIVAPAFLRRRGR